MQLPEVEAKIAVYNDLFEFMTVKTGLNVTEPEIVYQVFNTLIAQVIRHLVVNDFVRLLISVHFLFLQKSMNLTWPEWCTDDIFGKISQVTILQYELWAYTTEVKRIHGGPLVRRFIENMFLNKTIENPRKMYLYSAHEQTIAAYLQAQGILEPKIPHYGTAVMVEKLEDSDGKIYIRVSSSFVKNFLFIDTISHLILQIVAWTGVTEQLITLRVPGCEDICPIETYLQLTSEIIPSDEEMNCHWNRLTVDELRRVFDESISE